jgi:hypothetical protein
MLYTIFYNIVKIVKTINNDVFKKINELKFVSNSYIIPFILISDYQKFLPAIAPQSNQYSFQLPGTRAMFLLIETHHDLLSFLFFILGFLIVFFLVIIYTSGMSKFNFMLTTLLKSR